MVIFYSYVSLPEGTWREKWMVIRPRKQLLQVEDNVSFDVERIMLCPQKHQKSQKVPNQQEKVRMKHQFGVDTLW